MHGGVAVIFPHFWASIVNIIHKKYIVRYVIFYFLSNLAIFRTIYDVAYLANATITHDFELFRVENFCFFIASTNLKLNGYHDVHLNSTE